MLSDLLHADDTTTISALAKELAVTRRIVLRDRASLRARSRISSPRLLRDHVFREDLAIIRAQVPAQRRWRSLDTR